MTGLKRWLLIMRIIALAAPGAALAAPAADTAAATEKAFFAKTGRGAGMIVLPGLTYTVLKAGPTDGAHPSRSDTVTVHYIGKLTDGTQFDASGGDGTGEASFKVSDVIAGFSAALKLMRPGDRWRVYIPAYLAYGDQPKPQIPPGSSLVFDMELIAITPKVSAP